MKLGPRYKVKFRRRREGKTNYRYRLKLLKSGLPRAVVRCTNRNIIVQFVEYDPIGDKVIASCVSSILKKQFNWKYSTANTPAAYLSGLLTGVKARDAGVKKAVLDIGLHTPTRSSRVFATLKGILDAGIEIPHGDEIFPSTERLMGKHISPDMENVVLEIKKKILEE